MESLLFRTGSGSVPLQAPPLPGSPRLSVSMSVTNGVFNGEPSPKMSLHMEISRRNIRRSSSEPNIFGSMRALSKLGSRSFAALPIAEVEYDEGRSCAGDWPENGVSWEELGSPGGGTNANGKSGGSGSGGSGSDADRPKMGDYYQEMIKSNPTNSLLLRNYAKYLHEVEGDAVKAEEYYGRAILASPGDGEVLSLYGKLIWETQRDESRAKSYFTQALQASPHDCTVLGSYAHFLWEAEEEQYGDEDGDRDGDDGEIERESQDEVPIAAMVEAF